MIVYSGKRYIPQLKEIWKSVFRDTDDYINVFFKKKYRDEETLLYVDNGAVKAMLFFPCYKIKVFDSFYKAGYICGAATVPDCRGKGLMSYLLEKTFRVMEERGCSFSVLIPGEKSLYKFYSRYGYEGIFKRGVSVFGKKDIEKSSGAGFFIEEAVSAQNLMPVYKEVLNKHPVAVLQSAATYATVLEAYSFYGKVYILKNRNREDEAFMFCEYYSDSRTLRVKEFIARKNLLLPASAVLCEKYKPEKIIFEGIYSGNSEFEKGVTTGMLKIIKGDFNISQLESGRPYMNMMLD